MKHLKPKLETFQAFLLARGAEILKLTNEWEVVRFLSSEGTSIIYRKKDDTLTFTGEASAAWLAYKNGSAWRAMPATKRRSSTPFIATIRQRDGDLCFFCQKHVDMKDESVEHLVAITHGGPNHISNLFLAHRECNLNVGHLSAVEKIQVHITARIPKTPISAPWEE